MFAAQKEVKKSSFYSGLFDRKKDPYQLDNLFEEKKIKFVEEKLWSLTRQWMITFNDNFYEYKDFMNAATDREWNKPPFIRPLTAFPKTIGHK